MLYILLFPIVCKYDLDSAQEGITGAFTGRARRIKYTTRPEGGTLEISFCKANYIYNNNHIYHEKTLEKTERATKNGQSRDHSNIACTGRGQTNNDSTQYNTEN